jgi:hypothetical protein
VKVLAALAVRALNYFHPSRFHFLEYFLFLRSLCYLGKSAAFLGEFPILCNRRFHGRTIELAGGTFQQNKSHAGWNPGSQMADEIRHWLWFFVCPLPLQTFQLFRLT